MISMYRIGKIIYGNVIIAVNVQALREFSFTEAEEQKEKKDRNLRKAT